MTKGGAIACLKASSYTAQEVKNLINQIEEKEFIRKPQYVKVGDIYSNDCGGGLNAQGVRKLRPCVIIKVLPDCVLSIPLTSVENSLALYESHYRFGRSGWFTKQVVTVPMEYALNNYSGVYDNPKRLRKAVSALKEFINNSI